VLRDLFEAEAAADLDALDALLPRLHEPEALRNGSRHAHTLKGSAAVMNLAPVAAVAGALEALFDGLSEGDPVQALELVEPVRAAVHDLRFVVSGLLSGLDIGIVADDAEQSLRALVLSARGAEPVPARAEPECAGCAGLRRIVEATAAAQARTLRLLALHTGADPDTLAELHDLEATLAGAAPASGPAPAREASAPGAERGTLVVVEDSATLREVHRAALAAAGYEVRTAHDGEEALRLLEERAPDAVITDLDMPRMDGVRLTDAIRRDPGLSGIAIVVVTSREDEPTRARAMIAGADVYLIKRGLDPARLVEHVDRLLEAAA
jgi:CheY-like chemotaxis protein/HPt (histidine-containing phosphotransfer) domain-containing protein